jgi:hypothetical protein
MAALVLGMTALALSGAWAGEDKGKGNRGRGKKDQGGDPYAKLDEELSRARDKMAAHMERSREKLVKLEEKRDQKSAEEYQRERAKIEAEIEREHAKLVREIARERAKKEAEIEKKMRGRGKGGRRGPPEWAQWEKKKRDDWYVNVEEGHQDIREAAKKRRLPEERVSKIEEVYENTVKTGKDAKTTANKIVDLVRVGKDLFEAAKRGELEIVIEP